MAVSHDLYRAGTLDVQWLERMYNNRMRVPAHGDYFARWAAASELARRSVTCQLDLPYGDGPREALDVFPAASKGAPLAVFVHGGYWKSLDKSQHGFVAAALHDLGAAVVVPNYGRCPQSSVMQITLQLARATAWAWRHAREFNADPRRVVVVGHSAGAHAAAMLLTCVWSALDPALPAGLVKGALGLSGIYDLVPLMSVPSLQEVLRITPQQALAASPARLPAPRRGRFYAVVGGQESAEFLRQNRLLQRMWGRQCAVLAQTVAELNHFSILDALAEPGSRVHALARRLLRSV
ncbi:MAG: alpha/beta hydrolase [Burkholderiaceae bacterium]|jgi:arylformamidase|nr:alpha/beta hydrolase [Burkholderiaceae bacterium]